MKEEKQARIAQETLDIYAPLANRLGISWIKTELEDLSFKYLKPKEFVELTEKVDRRKKEREKYIDDVRRLIETKLKERSIPGKVQGRFKHVYSIYKKMHAQGIEFDQVPRHHRLPHHHAQPAQLLRGAGAGAPAVEAGAGALQGLHRDPQAEHVPVAAHHGDRPAVRAGGGADPHRGDAHDRRGGHRRALGLQGGPQSSSRKDDEKFAWLRQLMEWQQDLKDPKEFLETVKVDLFTDEVFVFTPKGDVKSLPRGATPVDFAYAIHSDVGGRCVGAKVNGKIVPLRYKLKNGDTVEVLTSPQAHPSKDWLTFVKTSRAQQRIRGFIKQQQRDKSLQLGRELADKEFKRFELNLNKSIKIGELKKLADEMGYRIEDDLLVGRRLRQGGAAAS